MKVGMALKMVLARWNLTKYRIAQLSGVSQPSINRVVNGKQATLSWDDAEKIANGLAKVDPLAAGAFYYALSQPERFFYQAGLPPQPDYEDSDDSDDNEQEDPENG